MQTNFLIIGSGISGLNFALHAAKKGRVLIITKKKIIDSSTNYAQGGIAAVLDKTDDFKQHIKDTLEAGAYHNDKKAATFMIKNSTAAVHRLMNLGVEFAKENGELKLTREGGHHTRRIAYVGDYTGKEIERILVKRVKEDKNITILEDAFALKLLTKSKTCFGAQIIHENKIKNILADQTIIATGGIGQLYEYTTNPSISTGDGIALGVAAGCKTRDLEFIQFHPTALAKDTYPRFLISETVRGEGARLINSKGQYFMEKVHPLKDLAPRDIVAREIYDQMKNGPVYLDCKEIAKKLANESKNSSTNKYPNHYQAAKILENRFPQIYKELLKHGLHMEKDLIPVTPAAHYICGGIVTDLHGRVELAQRKKIKSGKTRYIKNFFAFGEVTCTGVHGANRLASNSLLEALVFSNQIMNKLTKIKNVSFSELTGAGQNKSLTGETFSKTALALKQQIKHLMWQHAGIIRNRKKIKEKAIPEMKKIIEKLEKIQTENNRFPSASAGIDSNKKSKMQPPPLNQTLAETLNMAQVSLLILKSAYLRKKSLGCHFIAPTNPKSHYEHQ